MKRITAVLLALLLLLTALPAVGAFASDTEPENAGKPSVILESNEVKEGGILIVTVSLSGCAGLTSADLQFTYDPDVLTYLGGSLRGAAAGDREITAALSDTDTAVQNGYVSLSLFHLNKFSAAAGNDELCELAFRAGSGRTKIKAKSLTFCIGDESVKPSLGKCRYSSGLSSFMKDNGSAVLVLTVIGAVLIVLCILLVVIRRTKKAMRGAQTDEAADETASDGSSEIDGETPEAVGSDPASADGGAETTATDAVDEPVDSAKITDADTDTGSENGENEE